MMTLVASDGLWPNADILRRLETEIATFLLDPIILDHLLESNIFFGFEVEITNAIFPHFIYFHLSSFPILLFLEKH